MPGKWHLVEFETEFETEFTLSLVDSVYPDEAFGLFRFTKTRRIDFDRVQTHSFYTLDDVFLLKKRSFLPTKCRRSPRKLFSEVALDHVRFYWCALIVLDY